MALTRAQLLMGNISQGTILAGQVQGVRAGLGITINTDGTIEVNSQTIVGVMKMGQSASSAAAAYNGYEWPTIDGLAGQQLETDGSGVLTWADSDGIDWTAKGQLIVGTGVATDTLLNVGSSTSMLMADPSSGSGLSYTDSLNTAMLAVGGTTAQRPSLPVAGQFRYNEDTKKFEFYTGTAWEEVASGNPIPGGNTFVKESIPLNPAAQTGNAIIPSGTTLQRQTLPAPVAGSLRYNTDLNQFELWTGTGWAQLPASTGFDFVLQTRPPAGKTASAVIPAGTTAERETAGATGGWFRFNTDNSELEFFNGIDWDLITPSQGAVSSFVQAATPTARNVGDIWYDTLLQRESVWDGAAWVQPGVTQTDPTGFALMPTGTTAERGAPTSGGLRLNSDTGKLEFWNGANWDQVASGDPTPGGNTYVEQSVPSAPAGATGNVLVPSGTTAQRQTSPAPVLGSTRFNTTTGKLEVLGGSGWETVPSATTGTFVPQTEPTTGTASAVIPTGDTAGRQTAPLPVQGYTRFNTDTTLMEVFDGTIWVPIGAPPNAGLGLNLSGVVPNQILKASVPQQSTPPTPGTLLLESISGSLYWDDVLSQLFIRYENGGAPTWVQAAPSAGSIGITSVTGTLPIVVANGTSLPAISINVATTAAQGSIQLATAAEAAAGTDAAKAITSAFSVPKNAAGMSGAALIPGGNDGARPAPVTGMFRYNNQGGTPVKMEYYNGAAWSGFTGSAAAWVNFNSTGAAAIRNSSNVSSITDLGVGYFSVNFTSALSTADYLLCGSGEGNTGFPTASSGVMGKQVGTSFSTTSFAMLLSGVGTAGACPVDMSVVTAGVFT